MPSLSDNMTEQGSTPQVEAVETETRAQPWREFLEQARAEGRDDDVVTVNYSSGGGGPKPAPVPHVAA